MVTSTTRLPHLLASLSTLARRAGWSDAEWARRSGLPKETLCRLRTRSNCDFETLDALARPVGASLTATTRSPRSSAEVLWPTVVDRALEAKVVETLGSGTIRPDDWLALGPPFFLSGLAVMLASVHGTDRRKYLELAENLHPGATEPRVFARWLAESPLPPARILPMLEAGRRRAA